MPLILCRLDSKHCACTS